jgi:hypothetical protein
MRDNLLASLHKLAKGQDENFITEALVHLLRFLIEREPTPAGALLALLTNKKIKDAAAITQITTRPPEDARNQPDLVLRTSESVP